jgi:nucleoside-diphosphate-sugar epimerase
MAGLLCFGMGFCAEALASRLLPQGWTIIGTSRSQARIRELAGRGHRAVTFGDVGSSGILSASPLYILVSAPPDETGDPALQAFSDRLSAMAGNIAWVGYLSTTGVYGDRQGDWVTEESPAQPLSERGRRRLKAENDWFAWGLANAVPVQVFRLAGIYGPGRNQLVSVLEGTARRIEKPGQVFSRIHVEDVATVLQASMRQPNPGRLYNVCDDEPAPPQEVVAFAANLLGREPPALEPYELAKATLSPMAASFYQESKRVDNSRMKAELGVHLAYPTFREGLSALQIGMNALKPA